MRVICIGDCRRVVSEKDKKQPVPTIGEECFVIDTVKAYGTFYYKLKNYPPKLNYLSAYFALISDIDETEFNRNYKTEPCSI
jgi:hypothetical protein